MSLSAGERLGPYEVLALIGAGGMGEVYRARDTKLKRDVAVKVLPEAFARDPDRMARFQREAEVLASLNHPTIAHIYGVEDRALVMELADGESPKGPMAFDDAWKIAMQIADALDYAHEKGVIHRDLKPANVKVTPDGVVKLLDFGLAKALSPEVASAGEDPGNSPTLTMGATVAGVILGTAAYMAPEQAKGKKVDRRADIWSWGVVLYELLTGERMFRGEDAAETLAQVLTKEPDLERVPANVRKLLRSCLEKDPKKRLRDIGDAGRLIDSGTEVSQQATSLLHTKLPWAVAAGLAVIAAGLGWVAWRSTRPLDRPLMRMNVDLGPDALTGTALTAAISPDGTRIVFPMRRPGGGQQLTTRLLDQATPTVLSGTDDAQQPFFSPDGQWIGFFAEGKLKKISVLGGAALALCDASNPRGASWGEDGNIIAALNATEGLSLIPAAGGPPQALTKPRDKGDATHRWPQVLPGGNAVLFSGQAALTGWDDGNVEVLSLKNGALKAGETKVLLRGGYFPRYLSTAASSGGIGHLVYLHEGVLMGVALDPVKLELRGTPAPLLEDVAGNTTNGGGEFDFSRTGTFAYLGGKPATTSWPVVWLDSSGKTQPLLAKPGLYNTPRFSPDGNLLALSASVGKGSDIYVYDWRHDTMPRLTFTGHQNFDSVWTPDGKHIAFSSIDGLWWVRPDGASEPQRLLETKNQLYAHSFSPDGKRLSYAEAIPGTGFDIFTLPLDLSDPEHPKPGKPEVFLSTPANEIFGTFSPDGRWIAYASDESGRPEIYVRPFPGPGGKWQISTGGGRVPTWSRDGRMLFYATLDNRIMVSEDTAKGDSFTYSKPRLWSDVQVREAAGRRYFDIAPDGKRFAVFPLPDVSQEKQGDLHVVFLLNFFDEVRRRIPAN